MIYQIQAFEVEGKGTATELKIEVQNRFTTQDKAVIYYDLRDTTQTSVIHQLNTEEVLTLPYKVLFYKKITVTGAARDAVVGDEKQAVDIFKRERTDITIKAGGIELA